MDEQTRAMPHHLILEGRNRLSISGVENVESFDETGIVCQTTKGILIIKGSDLHVDRLNIEGGELSLEGQVDSMGYDDSVQDKGGSFLSRLFR